MSQPDLDFFVRRGLTGKLESTENVDPVPVIGTNGILIMNGKTGTEFDKKELVLDKKYFSNNKFGVANKRCYIEGDFFLNVPAAPGTGAADSNVLLSTGGLTKTNDPDFRTMRYTPITDGIASGTFYWWHTDTFKKVTGARNNISSLKIEIGERAMGKSHVQGNYINVTKSALPDIVLPDVNPPVCTYDKSEAYVHIGADMDPELLVWAKMIEVNFGSKLGSKEYTSVKKQKISDRLATFNFKMAKADLDEFNPWTERDAGNTVKFRIRQYETSPDGFLQGLYVEIGVRGQIETIEETDIDGDLGWMISGPCIATSAGGDEFYLEFGNDAFAFVEGATYESPHVHAVPYESGLGAPTGRYAGDDTLFWHVTEGALPAWATMSSVTGIITGAAPTAGTTVFTVTCEDEHGGSVSIVVSITIT